MTPTRLRSGDIEFAKVGSSTLIIVESLRSFISSHLAESGQAMIGR
jgi:hypothetical protein